MFVAKVAKPRTRASAVGGDFEREPNRGPATFRRAIGNQAGLRLLPGCEQQEQVVGGNSFEGASAQDFSEIPAFTTDRPEQASWQVAPAMRPRAPGRNATLADGIHKASVENGAMTPPSAVAISAAAAHVTMRDDPAADRSAYLLGAHAVAFGDQILFRHGCYAPGTEPGRALIAHELAHVVHQGQTGRPYPQRMVAGDVLSVQFTQAMAEAMTSSELDQQMQLLRAYLLREPADRGAAENLAILETVARTRDETAHSASTPAAFGEEQHGKIWWWLREHGRLTMTKHDRAEVQRAMIKQSGGIVVDDLGFPVDVDQLSDDEVVTQGPGLLRSITQRSEDQSATAPEMAAIISRGQFADIVD